MESTNTFARSEHAFFHQDRTKQAIVDLAQQDALLIYCGAGVTIDRTGLSWGTLVAELFKASCRADGDPRPEDVHMMAERTKPLELASVLAEYARDRHGGKENARAALVPHLQSLLYTSNGWQAGALVRNIMRLSFGFMQLDKPVTIITSNYDTYLEDAYADYRAEQESSGAEYVPGLRVSALGSKGSIRNTMGKGGLPQILVVYLHGRVPREGRPCGAMALSEGDYYSIRPKEIHLLAGSFSKSESGLLILGSSLTDPPLLEALSLTGDDGPGPDGASRYAITPAGATGMIAVPELRFTRLKDLLAKRGDHFSLQTLFPDFHFQIAQFCQEVLTAATSQNGPSAYFNDEVKTRYGLRLSSWWEAWKAMDKKRGPDETYALLQESLAKVRTKIGETTKKSVAKENMRLELWVRHKPSDRNRTLALWASSAGILWDRTLLREEDLSLVTRNAPVRAFLAGQPQYISLAELHMGANGPEPATGRWHSFLSTPILIETGSGTLPVGVVTLSTTRPKSESGIPERSTLPMREIVELLNNAGLQLLDVQEQVVSEMV